jgi:hypothetical protein
MGFIEQNVIIILLSLGLITQVIVSLSEVNKKYKIIIALIVVSIIILISIFSKRDNLMVFQQETSKNDFPDYFITKNKNESLIKIKSEDSNILNRLKNIDDIYYRIDLREFYYDNYYPKDVSLDVLIKDFKKEDSPQ